VGEIDIEHVIRQQAVSDNHILFASGINHDFYSAKLAIYNDIHPSAIVIGSSRGLEFRRAFFKTSFVNMGGCVSSVAHFERLVSDIEAIKERPKLAIVVLDFWWFNEHIVSDVSDYQPSSFPRYPTISLCGYAIATMASSHNWPSAFVIPKDRLGLMGVLSNAGFDRYGSFYYVSTITGEIHSKDEQFKETESAFAKGEGRFAPGATASEVLIDRFTRAAFRLRDLGVHFVAVMPPVAPPITNLINKSGRYAYIPDLRMKLATRGIELLDYSDAHALASNDLCAEFLDGFHGGDVIYARIANEVAKSDVYSAAFIDFRYLQRFIASNSGRAEGDNRFDRNHTEVDFLKLGVLK